MCFSAPVSFVASGVLAAAGAASLCKAGKTTLRWYAAVPLLFAVQQFIEGMQWVALKPSALSLWLGYGFLFFAFLVWPVYVPLAVCVIEKNPVRKEIMRWFGVVGVLLVAYLVVMIVSHPLAVEELSRSIWYHIDVPFTDAGVALYVFVTSGSALASSRPGIRLFGGASLLSVFGAIAVYNATFTSVWCFFVAALSVIVWIDLALWTKKIGKRS